MLILEENFKWHFEAFAFELFIVVKEGQCSGRKGPGKGRSPAAARAPLWGPGREGRRLLQRRRLPLGPRHFPGIERPGILARQPCTGAAVAPSTLPSGPTRTPACMHGEETGL